MRRVTKLEPMAPHAALQLFEDQVRAGHRKPYRPGDLANDRFKGAAKWERSAMSAPITDCAALARVARASLTGKSPRTRHGRWRRDLAYLEAVEAEAEATLPFAEVHKYAGMVVDWRKREPLGILGRYLALRGRRRERAR